MMSEGSLSDILDDDNNNDLAYHVSSSLIQNLEIFHSYIYKKGN